MPNWCYNNAVIRHEDPAQIARVVKAINDKGLFQEFVPCPDELNETVKGHFSDENKQRELEAQWASNQEKYGFGTWYEWNMANWGTKWDAGDLTINSQDDNEVGVYFETAWCPPIAFYETMEELGFTINATYGEESKAFIGRYADGVDECYNIDEYTGDWVRENIPEELDEEYGYSDDLDMWAEDEDDSEEGEAHDDYIIGECTDVTDQKLLK
jgi:hypothetical protein